MQQPISNICAGFDILHVQKGNILFFLPAAIAHCENQPNSASTTNFQQVKDKITAINQIKKFVLKKHLSLPILRFGFLKFQNVQNSTFGTLKKMHLYNWIISLWVSCSSQILHFTWNIQHDNIHQNFFWLLRFVF